LKAWPPAALGWRRKDIGEKREVKGQLTTRKKHSEAEKAQRKNSTDNKNIKKSS
jgi:hypothetical protein